MNLRSSYTNCKDCSKFVALISPIYAAALNPAKGNYVLTVSAACAIAELKILAIAVSRSPLLILPDLSYKYNACDT